MKILQITTGTGWSGGQRQVFEICKGLTERGHDVILGVNYGAKTAEVALDAGLKVVELPIKREANPVAPFALRKLLKEHGAQVVATHKPKPITPLLFALRGLPTTLVCHRRVTFNADNFISLHMKWRNKRIDGFIGNSKAAADMLHRSGIAPERVKVVYSASDMGYFDTTTDGGYVREEYGVASGDPLIVMGANYIQWKGYDTFIEVAERVRERFPGIKFLGVGEESAYTDEMRKSVAKKGLTDTVLLPGFRKDMPAVLATADVLMHCTLKGDSAAGIIREGHAMALPALVSAVGGNDELVIDGETGRTFPAGDAAAAAQALEWMLENREECARMAQAGQQWARANLDVDAMVDHTLEAYRYFHERAARK